MLLTHNNTFVKARKDRYSSINNTGVEGFNKPCDTSMENFIEDSKSILKATHARLSPLQVDKAIEGLNISQYVKEQQLLMMEMPVRKPDKSSSKISGADLAVVEKMMIEADPFSTEREKLKYKDDLHTVYEGEDLLERLDHFFELKMACYERDRSNQPF